MKQSMQISRDILESIQAMLLPNRFKESTIISVIEQYNGNIEEAAIKLISMESDYNSFAVKSAQNLSKEKDTLKSSTESLFANDWQAFCKIKERFESSINSTQIETIWAKVRSEYPHQPLDTKYALAVSLLEDTPESISSHSRSSSKVVYDLTHDDSSGMDDMSSSTAQYATFLRIFGEGNDIFLPLNKLNGIWNCFDESLGDEDRLDLAVQYVVELLESGDMSKSNYDVSEVVKEQEVMRRRLYSSSSPDNKSGQIQKSSTSKLTRGGRRHLKGPDTKDVVINMVSEYYEEVSDLSKDQVREVCEDCRYDIELCLERLWDIIVKKRGFIREDLNFSEALKRTAEAMQTGKGPVDGGAYSSQPYAEYEAISDSSIPSSILDGKQKRGHSYYSMANHFLSTARLRNPQLKLDLNEESELSFQGIKRNETCEISDQTTGMPMQYVDVDLHCLSVQRALELVHSLFTYFQDNSRRLGRKFESIQMRLIVGKGLHSPGGVPKIWPAVEKYLRQRGERNWVTFDGGVMIRVKLK